MHIRHLIAGWLVMAGCALEAAEQPLSLVSNGAFEKGLAGWSASATGVTLVSSPRGGQCVQAQDGCGLQQNIYVGSKPRAYTAAVDVKAQGIVGGGYAYAAVYQLDLHGRMTAFKDFIVVRDAADWGRHSFTFELAPGAEVVSLRCGIFNARGTAWFDNWTLVEGRRACRFDEAAQVRSHTGTEKGVVGILRSENFPTTGTPSSPEALADMIRAGGADAGFLTIADLSDPAQLTPSRFDIVVLPCGESFPGAAREAFVHYLRSGGKFISIGGYAFNSLLFEEGGRWVPEKTYASRLAEALHPDKSLLFDGGFEKTDTERAPGGKDLDAKWRRSAPTCSIVEENPAEGKRCAKVEVAAVAGPSEVKWDLRAPAVAGREYRVSALVRTRDVAPNPNGFAYVALYQHGPDEKLIKHRDFAQVKGTTEWTRFEYDFSPEPGVTTLYIKCGLYLASGTAWFDGVHLADITGLRARPMNTGTGVPQDGLVVGPMQIGVFDADYRLKRVAAVKSAPAQHIFPPDVAFGPVKGWAASAVRGMDSTRWVPLLAAYDRYGRERGSAGSLLIHYSGFYNDSAWAYFGVEDVDLFAKGNAGMAAALQNLVRFMHRGVYLRNLRAEFAGYHPGERVNLEVVVENRGGRRQEAVVKFLATNGLFETSRAVALEPASSSVVKADFELPPAIRLAGLCPIKAVLELDRRPVDEMESAFVALAPAGHAAASPLRFTGNYFRYGERPIFLFGCDNYSNVYKSSTEGPLWWAREHAACRDFGFEIYENLQYRNPGHRMEEADWRNFLAMSQLTQQHGLVFMPGLLIGHNVAVSDEVIAGESRLCEEYARRLKDTPRLLWYINGDYQLRHNDLEALQRKWSAFLKEKYGAEIGDDRFPPKNTGRWDDARQIDLHLFHLKLMTDWNRAHVAAIRRHDPAHPITSEYYQRPFWGIDLRLTLGGQDVSNIGYFDRPEEDITKLPLRIRWNDMRAQGKSVSLGEYGVKTHPAWTVENGARGYHIVRTEEEAKQLFMAVAHYAFGLGGSKVQNWCLRDADQRVFPWGVFYPGPLVPKDVACTHRNLSLLLRVFEPQYEAPPLTVLICDNARLGNHPDLGTEGVLRCFEALLGLHADFNVLSDWHIKEIPASTRVMIYPAALCPGDESFEGLVEWVKAGGKLLLTGGCVYNGDRAAPAGSGPTRADRLRRLAGVEWVQTLYTPTERPARAPGPMFKVRPCGAEIIAAAADGVPLLTRHTLGKGVVWLYTDPLELGQDAPEGASAVVPGRETGASGKALRELYRRFLDEVGVKPIPVAPDDPDLHIMRTRTRTGLAHVLFDYDKDRNSAAAPLEAGFDTGAGRMTLKLKARYPALAGVGSDGQVRVLGAFRGAKVGPDAVLEADGLVAAVALDAADLRKSEAVMILPFSEGKVSLHSSQRSWRRPVVLFGDVCDGRFRVLEEDAHAPGAAITVNFDADRATLFAVVCEADARRKSEDTIETLVSRPETFPGF